MHTTMTLLREEKRKTKWLLPVTTGNTRKKHSSALLRHRSLRVKNYLRQTGFGIQVGSPQADKSGKE